MKREKPEFLQKAEQEHRWLEENREAIEAYNRRLAQNGLCPITQDCSI
jgi:post-segregation antitoxin (ccd killing protein)